MKKYILPLLLLAIFFFLSLQSALHESLTFDEVVDLQEGRNAVLHNTFNIDPYNPPLSREIAIFPYIFQRQFFIDESYMYRYPLYGRLTMIVLGVGLLASVYFFAKKYIGEKEAVFSLILMTFEPTLLANSHYITMDIGLTLFFFISFCLFISLLKKRTWVIRTFFALSLGFGMATKISFIPYFLLSGIGMLLIQYKKIAFLKVLQHLRLIVVICFVASLAIWSAYFFHTSVMIKPRQDSMRVSSQLHIYAQKHHIALLADSLFFLENQPMPLGDFLATIKNNALRSLHSGNCFFLGKNYPSCRWYFLPINFLLKAPLPLLIFFIVSFGVVVQKKKKEMLSLFLLTPIGVIFFTSMVLRFNPLVRYVLPLFPFVILFSSLSYNFWIRDVWRKVFLGILLLWYIAGTLGSYPHFLSFANELTFGQKQFLLTDSNMDWGQNLPDVQRFVKENPAKKILFSYFGRDNGDLYGLQSDKPYGSYKNNDICEFHVINPSGLSQIGLISATNWYACGYNTNKEYSKSKIKGIVGDSIIMF